MNAILHQWKWDFRRIRTVWISWLLLLAVLTFGTGVVHLAGDSASRLSGLLTLAKVLTVFLLGTLIMARVIYTTPFAGATGFWKTRPLGRRDLFWSKTLMILLLLWAPVVIVQAVSWARFGANPQFLFWGSVNVGALVLAMLLLAGTWAILCEGIGSFVFFFALSGGWAAFCAILLRKAANRIESLPVFIGATGVDPNSSAVSTGTATAALLFLASAMAVAWLLAGLRGSPHSCRAAVAVLVGGIALANTSQTIWTTGFLAKGKKVPTRELPVVVLDASDPLPAGHQLLWSQLAVGIPAGQFAKVDLFSGSFQSDTDATGSTISSDHADGVVDSGQTRAIAPHYPDNTEILLPMSDDDIPLDLDHLGKTGTLQGEIHLSVLRWRKVASLPVRERARTHRDDGGTIGITRVAKRPQEVVVSTSSLRPPRGYREPNPLGNDRYGGTTLFVLHQPTASRAVVGQYGGSIGTMAFLAFSMEANRESVSFPRHQLAGSGGAGVDLDGASLDIFVPELVTTAKSEFRREHWTVYINREAPADKPGRAMTRVEAGAPLPRNPNANEVDAYIDDILTNLAPNPDRKARRTANDRLRAIGPEHLDRLVARLPVAPVARDIPLRVIRELATDRHRDLLAAALDREPLLANIFLERHWEESAAPILAERLRRHAPLDWQATPPVVMVVAHRADPSTFEDLRWHFVHSPFGHRRMATALRDCPGFPLEEAIADLWARARFEYDSRRKPIAVLAAGIGDKEALRLALVHYADNPDENELRELAEIVRHPEDSALPQWMHTHFADLFFDPEEGRWDLPR